jgi:hypothetical protein
MERVGLFLAGFASGWVVRTTVDSSRSLAVGLISTFYEVSDRLNRVVSMEREHLEDLIAEGRARFETDRARAARRAQGAGPAAVPRQERAA